MSSCIIRALLLPMAYCVLVLPVSDALRAQRPYSVDLMLKTEGIGEVAFSPQGDRLLVEKLEAYDASLNYEWFMYGHERATLLDAELTNHVEVRPIPSENDDRTWISSYSPSGAKAAVSWFDGTIARIGVYEFESSSLRKFDLPANVAGTDDYNAHWISEDEFIIFSQPVELQRKIASHLTYRHDLRNRLRKNSWRGDEPGVTVFGSGKHRSNAAITNNGLLLRMNVRTGETNELSGSEFFWQLSLSPDRRHFAALREVGELDLGDLPAKPIFGRDKHLQLVVYDLTHGSTVITPCASCNVTRFSLRWSPSGRKLFFSARVKRKGRIDHEYYIYDFARAVLERFTPKNIVLKTVEDLRSNAYVTPFVWLTEDIPAVRVTVGPPALRVGHSSEPDRHDWYALLPGRAPVALTAGLKSASDTNPLEDLVAIHQGKILIMADGDLWQIAPDGTRKNLTQSIDEPLSPWCSVEAYHSGSSYGPVCSVLDTKGILRPVDRDALERGWLTFRASKGDSGNLLFLNIDSGKIVRISGPDPQAKLASASAVARSAAYIIKGNDGDRLLLASADGTTREILHFNQHLAGIAGGEPVLLTRHEPGEAEDRYDWLLLPPGHQPGQRHPLLVYFYPETQYNKEWRGDDLRSVNFLNMQVPAARGYAVLMASMKISPTSATSNPMTEMHDQVIRAAEHAVRAGYADPVRWAVMGHSYGGYGTSSIITQTKRFKAAIALAGSYNLTSHYASGLDDLSSPARVSRSAAWAEGGQGRMGVPPWQDPQRYISNSPLFFVDKIETPLMLIHGDDDGVSVSEAEQMFHALLRLNKDAVFLRYWGEAHFFTSPATIRNMWNHIFAWLDEHLGVKRDVQGSVMLKEERGSIPSK